MRERVLLHRNLPSALHSSTTLWPLSAQRWVAWVRSRCTTQCMLSVRERQRRRARLAAQWRCALPRHDILCPSQRDDLRKHSSHSLTSDCGGSFSLSLQGPQACALLHMSIPSSPPCRYSTLAQLGGSCCCSCPSVGWSHGLNTWVTEATGSKRDSWFGFFFFVKFIIIFFSPGQWLWCLCSNKYMWEPHTLPNQQLPALELTIWLDFQAPRCITLHRNEEKLIYFKLLQP